MGRPFTAVVLGGTGACGSALIKELLKRSDVTGVTSIGRRKLDFVDETSEGKEKLKEIVVDMEQVDTIKDQLPGHDVAFCCLSTTKKDAGSEEAFRKIDSDYVVNFGKLCKEANIPVFTYVSSDLASPNSWLFYLKVKGETEEKLKELSFKRLNLMQPGLLDRLEKSRTSEKILKWMMPSISVVTVAKAMVATTIAQLDEDLEESKVQNLKNAHIKKLAAQLSD